MTIKGYFRMLAMKLINNVDESVIGYGTATDIEIIDSLNVESDFDLDVEQ
ncbi:hypothetical protein PIROE2DRAFT_1462 [Piromyces sp. E2]|nr:hypothetical protein PIROE2DRAFT_1462 [Piromyces sp. E2]|eukprot:OUM70329.1 hypothetical protein PIROE2DRAFT_1462 [Piromyces sp. E2]